MWLTYRFERPTQGFNNDLELEEDEGPTLRPASQEIDAWVVDKYLTDGKCTDQQRLNCYLI